MVLLLLLLLWWIVRCRIGPGSSGYHTAADSGVVVVAIPLLVNYCTYWPAIYFYYSFPNSWQSTNEIYLVTE